MRRSSRPSLMVCFRTLNHNRSCICTVSGGMTLLCPQPFANADVGGNPAFTTNYGDGNDGAHWPARVTAEQPRRGPFTGRPRGVSPLTSWFWSRTGRPPPPHVLRRPTTRGAPGTTADTCTGRWERRRPTQVSLSPFGGVRPFGGRHGRQSSGACVCARAPLMQSPVRSWVSPTTSVTRRRTWSASTSSTNFAEMSVHGEVVAPPPPARTTRQS